MNDLISRQAAIDALERGKDKTAKGNIGGFYNTIIQNDIDKLRNLPSVNRLQGEWLHTEIIDDDGDLGVNSDATQCSICGDYQNNHDWAKTYFHYCPNCGAEMKGEE